MSEKRYYIYKITLLCGPLTNHYYIGKHVSNYNDKYTGCGKIVKAYLKEYGKVEGKTYVKEILEVNPDNLTNTLREKEIIGDKHKTDPMCVNLIPGGFGGSYVGRKHTSESIKKMSDSHKGHKNSKEHNENISKGLLGHYVSEESRQKMSKRKLGKHWRLDENKKRVYY